jgi:phenylalanyl-tRNA synthetase beta chain
VHPTSGEAFLIKKAKIRGADSEGMICAEDEIGLGESHAGVMVLPQDAPVGALAKTYFNIPEADIAIHIGLTPNRSDAMSHIGVARDVCAYLTHHRAEKYAIKLAEIHLPEKGGKELNIKVNIDAIDACLRYTGISISGVKVGMSPEWLQQRLKTIGLRSINNIVDITNYVLHEYGQPLHAFDADRINDKAIHVRFLEAGTSFVTLDEKERKLRAEDLMICDGAGPVAIGGVFGGLHSGISDDTTNIFLESAYFNPTYIRRTSLHHGLRTDAATHFEKGVDMNNIIPALKRAAALILEIAGGEIASDIVDEYVSALGPVSIEVSYDYIQTLSGKNYAPQAVKDVLSALGFIIEGENEGKIKVIVPSNKTDVKQAADIVEEILRIDGLDNIVIPGRLNISLTKAMPNDREEREKISEMLCGMGLQEIVTNSIVNSKYYPGRNDLVKMLNSLSSELDVMRPALLESGLEVVQYNCNRKNQDLCLFEFGNVYTQTEGKYKEEAQLGIWATGNIVPQQWMQKAQKADLFYIKGVINNLLSYTGIKGVAVLYEEQNGNTVTKWQWNKQVLCTAVQVANERLQLFDIKQDVFFAVIHWPVWLKAGAANKIKYSELRKFPAVQRDLAIILERGIPYKQVQEATEQLKLDALQSFDLFDIFESEKLGTDKKSYALSYTFQLQDRTLTDTEIEQMMQQLMNTYKTKLSAQIRE